MHPSFSPPDFALPPADQHSDPRERRLLLLFHTSKELLVAMIHAKGTGMVASEADVERSVRLAEKLLSQTGSSTFVSTGIL